MTQKEELKQAIKKAKEVGVTNSQIREFKTSIFDHDRLVQAINIARLLIVYGEEFNDSWLVDFQLIEAIDSNYNNLNK